MKEQEKCHKFMMVSFILFYSIQVQDKWFLPFEKKCIFQELLLSSVRSAKALSKDSMLRDCKTQITESLGYQQIPLGLSGQRKDQLQS